jgi:translation initiation factor 2B subunit (eIF-2B alpha/beta/delta family)
VGRVVFPFHSPEKIEEARGYMKQSSKAVLSGLLELLANANDIVNAFTSENENIDDLSAKKGQLFKQNPELASLSQYIVHLLNVSEESLFDYQLKNFLPIVLVTIS